MAKKESKIAALALGSVEAPPAVKDSATEMAEASIALAKAEDQIRLWQREREKQIRQLSIAEKKFEQEFEKWDPAGLKSKKIEELPNE